MTRGMQLMIESGRISSRQATMLIFTAIIGSIFLFIPRIILDQTSSGGVFTLIIGTGIALVFYLPFYYFIKSFPNQTIFEITNLVLGKYLGGLLGLLFVGGMLFYTATVIRSMGEFFITMIMPETPLSVFIIAMLILTSITAAMGIEAIGRLNEFWLPIIFLTFCIIFLAASPHVELSRLRPILMKQDISNIAIASLKMFTVFAQFGALLWFYPFINDKEVFFKKSVISIIIACLVLITTYVTVVSFFGKDLTRYYVWPTLELTRDVRVAGFFERMESLFVIVWLLFAYIKISLFVYGSSLGIGQIFKLNKYNAVVPFLIALPIYYISFMPNNMPEVLRLVELWEVNGLTVIFSIVIPMFVLLVAKIRGGGKKNAPKEKSPTSNN